VGILGYPHHRFHLRRPYHLWCPCFTLFLSGSNAVEGSDDYVIGSARGLFIDGEVIAGSGATAGRKKESTCVKGAPNQSLDRIAQKAKT